MSNTFLKNMIESFAEEKPMVEILKSALIAYRMKSAVVSGSQTLAALWSGIAPAYLNHSTRSRAIFSCVLLGAQEPRMVRRSCGSPHPCPDGGQAPMLGRSKRLESRTVSSIQIEHMNANS